MWGEVTPAERLRAVTRRQVDEDRLAIEAADALAGFASEPASLVVACRRVLAHHRSCGPLWWVCARILAAADPGAGRARGVAAARGATAPPTGSARRLPLLDEDQVVAVVGWPEAVDLALIERLDVAAVALRVEGADPAPALRRRGRATRRAHRRSVGPDAHRRAPASSCRRPRSVPSSASCPRAPPTRSTRSARRCARCGWSAASAACCPAGSTTSCAGRRSRRPTTSTTTRPCRGARDRPGRLHRRTARRAARDRSRGPLRLPGRARAAPPARLTGVDVDDVARRR